MILDQLPNAAHYSPLGQGIAKALAFLNDPATGALEPVGDGPENSVRVEIDNDNIFALVQRYQPKLASEAFWEAHRRYIDVQCIVVGTERMGVVPLACTSIVKPYDSTRDFSVVEPKLPSAANFIDVHEGSFAILFPHDAHMPGLRVHETAGPVKKIVVKVLIDAL